MTEFLMAMIPPAGSKQKRGWTPQKTARRSPMPPEACTGACRTLWRIPAKHQTAFKARYMMNLAYPLPHGILTTPIMNLEIRHGIAKYRGGDIIKTTNTSSGGNNNKIKNIVEIKSQNILTFNIEYGIIYCNRICSFYFYIKIALHI